MNVESSTLAPVRWVIMFMVFMMSACASSPPVPDVEILASSPWAIASAVGENPAPWIHREFPGKRASLYRSARIDGRDAMAVESHSSASMLRQTVHVEAAQINKLRFSWKVPQLIAEADLNLQEYADSPVRVVLAFEGDRSKFSAKNAMLSELAHVLTGEPMPYATLVYVWCNRDPVERVVINPRTDRVREMVMESGPRNLHRWMEYERDIRADFLKAFGEQPGALVAIGVMTDTDNTGSTARAWYGSVQHLLAATVP